jgi:hypothetical protein
MTSKSFSFPVASILIISSSAPVLSQETIDLKQYCNTRYEQQFSSERQREGVMNQEAIYTPIYNTNFEDRVSSGDKDCSVAVGSYYNWKIEKLRAESMQTTALGVSKDNLTLGLANSKTQMYLGLGQVVGGLFGGLFGSGNQKAAVESQSKAEIEKTKILAQAQVDLERLKLEQLRIQAGYSPSPQAYPPNREPAIETQAQFQNVSAPSNTIRTGSLQYNSVYPRQESPHTLQGLQAGTEGMRQDVSIDSNPPFSTRPIEAPGSQAFAPNGFIAVGNSSPTPASPLQQRPSTNTMQAEQQFNQVHPSQGYNISPYSGQQLDQANAQYQATSLGPRVTNSFTATAPAMNASQNPLRKFDLAIAPGCTAATLIIQASSGQIYCAYPNGSYKAGRYFFDGTRLIPN